MTNKMIDRAATYRNVWNTIFYAYGIDALLTEGENEQVSILSTSMGITVKFTCPNSGVDDFLLKMYFDSDTELEIEVTYINEINGKTVEIEENYPNKIGDQYLHTMESIYINNDGIRHAVEII